MARLHEPRRKAVLGAALTAVIDRATAEVSSSFAAHGIDSIVLKGASIAAVLYPAGVRHYEDADFLVAPPDVERAAAALSEIGFREAAVELPDEQPVHARPWVRARDMAVVDLHTSLPWLGTESVHAWQTLRSRTELLEIGGEPVSVLRPEGIALHTALHALWHGPRAERPLADLAGATRTFPQRTWREAAELADQLGASPALAAGLRMDPRGASIAQKLGLEPTSAPFLTLAAAAPRGALALAHLAGKRGFRERSRFAGQFLVPNRNFMRAWSPLARNGTAGLVLAHTWRLALLAVRAGPALAAVWRASRSSQSSQRRPHDRRK